MKEYLFVFALTLSAGFANVDVPTKDVLGPDNSFRDPVMGVALTLPAGWELLGGFRWGTDNRENTFRFRPLWPSEAMPSLYYQGFRADSPRPSDFRAWFLDGAQKKEASRSGSGDYKNLPDTYEFKTINGQPAFSYMAAFTNGGRKWNEYFVRIAGETAYVMFFTVGTVEDIAAIRADIDRMAATVRVP